MLLRVGQSQRDWTSTKGGRLTVWYNTSLRSFLCWLHAGHRTALFTTRRFLHVGAWPTQSSRSTEDPVNADCRSRDCSAAAAEWTTCPEACRVALLPAVASPAAVWRHRPPIIIGARCWFYRAGRFLVVKRRPAVHVGSPSLQKRFPIFWFLMANFCRPLHWSMYSNQAGMCVCLCLCPDNDCWPKWPLAGCSWHHLGRVQRSRS